MGSFLLHQSANLSLTIPLYTDIKQRSVLVKHWYSSVNHYEQDGGDIPEVKPKTIYPDDALLGESESDFIIRHTVTSNLRYQSSSFDHKLRFSPLQNVDDIVIKKAAGLTRPFYLNKVIYDTPPTYNTVGTFTINLSGDLAYGFYDEEGSGLNLSGHPIYIISGNVGNRYLAKGIVNSYTLYTPKFKNMNWINSLSIDIVQVEKYYSSALFWEDNNTNYTHILIDPIFPLSRQDKQIGLTYLNKTKFYFNNLVSGDGSEGCPLIFDSFTKTQLKDLFQKAQIISYKCEIENDGTWDFNIKPKVIKASNAINYNQLISKMDSITNLNIPAIFVPPW
jgi:hypothetical protein